MSTTAHYHRRRPLRERAWWCMREMAAFNLEALLLTVADGAERAAAQNLRGYIRALERHGVLAHVRQKRDDSYRLANDLGPRAPIVRRRQRDVFDPNTGKPLQRPATGDTL